MFLGIPRKSRFGFFCEFAKGYVTFDQSLVRLNPE